jgi:hypothetical protein
MFVAYIIVTVLAAAANIYVATLDFLRSQQLFTTIARLGGLGILVAGTGHLQSSGRSGLLKPVGTFQTRVSRAHHREQPTSARTNQATGT